MFDMHFAHRSKNWLTYRNYVENKACEGVVFALLWAVFRDRMSQTGAVRRDCAALQQFTPLLADVRVSCYSLGKEITKSRALS